MKLFWTISLYIIGFVVFFTLMEMIEADKSIFHEDDNDNFLTGKTKLNKVNEVNELNQNHTILQPEDSKKPLKLSKEELGRHTWSLLHSVASSIPSLPTEATKKHISTLLGSLAELYPCKVCGKHFKEMLKENPIRYESREEFAYYLCDLHNKVNVRLGKPIYECKKTFDIWGGDCGCNVDE